MGKDDIAEGLELSSLIAIACTGFSPNHYRLFQFVLGWVVYGLDRKSLKSQLRTSQTIAQRTMRPEMMFGLVGSELYEVTVAHKFWKARLGRRLEAGLQRAYYQSAPREHIWDWQPNLDFRGSDHNGKSRLYVWGPPHLVNNQSEAFIYIGSGTFVHDCNYMILGLTMNNGLDMHWDQSINKVLEGAMCDACVVGSTMFGFDTMLTYNRMLYLDTVGVYRGSKFYSRQQTHIIPRSYCFNNHRTVIVLNNAYYAGNMYSEQLAFKGFQKRKTEDCSAMFNNPDQLALLGMFFLKNIKIIIRGLFM